MVSLPLVHRYLTYQSVCPLCVRPSEMIQVPAVFVLYWSVNDGLGTDTSPRLGSFFFG